MRGKVVMVDDNNNLFAVITDEDEFTVFELLDLYCRIGLGDTISGDLESLGRETFFNETKQEDFEVYVEDAHGSENTARRLLNVK